MLFKCLAADKEYKAAFCFFKRNFLLFRCPPNITIAPQDLDYLSGKDGPEDKKPSNADGKKLGYAIFHGSLIYVEEVRTGSIRPQVYKFKQFMLCRRSFTEFLAEIFHCVWQARSREDTVRTTEEAHYLQMCRQRTLSKRVL